MVVVVTEGVGLDAASEIVADKAGQRALDGGVLAVVFVGAVLAVPLTVTPPGVGDALLLGGTFPFAV